MIFIDDVTSRYPLFQTGMSTNLMFHFLEEPYIPFMELPKDAKSLAGDDGGFVDVAYAKYVPDPVEWFPWFAAGNMLSSFA